MTPLYNGLSTVWTFADGTYAIAAALQAELGVRNTRHGTLATFLKITHRKRQGHRTERRSDDTLHQIARYTAILRRFSTREPHICNEAVEQNGRSANRDDLSFREFG
ncbi:uncharacterized protein LOC141915268 [Tubulanus polymorphus]|uniref:uncharacterized protein LOC141915268 n=1 Tax=Tubulanus polymorphus TaxID=672921 RepID=UPI003DA55837